ncbi:MAG: hypothetical protein ABFR95_11615, partial [Actinomycetota bacterium]
YLEQHRGITVTKTPVEQFAALGDTVDFTWQIQVTNTGNTTLEDVLVEDGLVEDIDAPPTAIAACSTTLAELAPGETYTYDCTIEDRLIVEEEFANAVQATATGPDGAEFVDVAAAAVRTEDGLPATGSPLSALIRAALAMVLFGSALVLTTRDSIGAR